MKINIAGQEIHEDVPTLEQWNQWGKLPGINHGVRLGSVVPDALRDAPEFAALERVRQRLLNSEKFDREQAAAVGARNQELLAQYRQELESHTLQGLEPPQPPELEKWHGMNFAMEFFTRHHAILEGVEKHLLRERADDWRDHIRKKARANHVKRAKAEQALAEAQELMRPFEEARKAVDTAVERSARRTGSHNNPAIRSDSLKVTTTELAADEEGPVAAGAMDDNPKPPAPAAEEPRRPLTFEERLLAPPRHVPREIQEAQEALLEQRIVDNRLQGRR